MTKIGHRVVIDRPVAEVWAYVHEPANDPLWQSTLVESQQLTEGSMRLGTRIREVRRFVGIRVEVTYEVTEFEPTTRSAVKTVAGPVPFTGGYAFAPVDAGTRFTITGELDAHGLFKLAEPVFRRMAQRELETNLAHLKDLLETSSE